MEANNCYMKREQQHTASVKKSCVLQVQLFLVVITTTVNIIGVHTY